MDRVERTQRRLGQRTGSGGQAAIEPQQRQRVERLAGAAHEPSSA